MRAGTATVPVSAGFTLLELLVALGIFMVVATLLYGMVGTALSLWQGGEEKREIYESAQAILSRISSDLRSFHAGGMTLHAREEQRLLGDRDSQGRPRLRLVRTLSSAEKSATRLAGAAASPTEYLDLDHDAEELREGRLRPPGGLEEVLYALLPQEDLDPGGVPAQPSGVLVLLRGIRSPVGGGGSLFLDPELDDREVLLAHARPLVHGVLHAEFRYASGGAFGLGSGFDDETWDSTRGLLGDFRLYRGEDSVSEPRDDVFPTAIEVTLVLERPGQQARTTRLVRPLTGTDRSLSVADPGIFRRSDASNPYAKVGDEWIEIGSVSGRQVAVKTRGVRGTSPRAHPAGTTVRVGFTFRTVVVLPVCRIKVAE